MYEAKMITYDDLTPEEKDLAPDNGFGMEYASYIRITDNAGTYVKSDAMEPEDAIFFRDLDWIIGAINTAYQTGLIDGKEKT